jgi:hypothetical protein
VAVLENGREQGCVELFNFRLSTRAFAPPIGKVGILGEYGRERLGIVPIPPIHESVDQRYD